MTLISDEYREQNSKLHKDCDKYGSKGDKWKKYVLAMCVKHKTTSLLDYGCGKGSLAKAMPFYVTEYDPAIEEKAYPKAPHDIVACTDVLEHVEHENLDSVLNDLRELTKKQAFITIALRESGEVLPDGRNSHLIVKCVEWWVGKLEPHFKVKVLRENYRDVLLSCEAKQC